MQRIYFEQNGITRGPCELRELKTLARTGMITPGTLLWQEGASQRIPAGRIEGLFPVASASGASDHLNLDLDAGVQFETDGDWMAGAQSGAASLGAQSFQTVRSQLSQLIFSISRVDFRRDIVPLDRELMDRLLWDTVFWVVMGLAAVPLLISTIDRTEYQLTAFALFFSILWGGLFKTLIVKSETNWKPLLTSLFFTGLIGIPCLLFAYESLLPEAYVRMSDSESGFTSLMGYVFHVGVCEELVKIVPVFAYLLWNRTLANPCSAILIGVFSGLGFAAFENMAYGELAIYRSAVLAQNEGVMGAAAGTQLAMVNVLLRSLSLVFCHAVWSGIFAWFVTAGSASGKSLHAMTLIGLMVSAVLHGVYDWLTGVQMTIATAVVVLSFVLFYAYLTNFRQQMQPNRG